MLFTKSFAKPISPDDGQRIAISLREPNQPNYIDWYPELGQKDGITEEQYRAYLLQQKKVQEIARASIIENITILSSNAVCRQVFAQVCILLAPKLTIKHR